MFIPERWQDDWMLWLIIFAVGLILLFEWIERTQTIPTFGGWLKESFGTATAESPIEKDWRWGIPNQPDASSGSELPDPSEGPIWLPWRDWKPAGAIPTLLSTPDRPNQLNTTVSKNTLKGGRWGWAPPQPACEVSSPIEGASTQPVPMNGGLPGPMPVGVISQTGTTDTFERPGKTQDSRKVLAWQPGRTRVCLTSWEK